MSQENVSQVVEWKVYSSDICGKRYDVLFRICIVMEREIGARTKNRNWDKNKNWKGNRNIQWQVFKKSCSKNWPKFRASCLCFGYFFSIKQPSNQQLPYKQYLVTNVIFFCIPSDPNAIAWISVAVPENLQWYLRICFRARKF